MAQLNRIFVCINPQVGVHIKQNLDQFIGEQDFSAGIELFCSYSEYPEDLGENDILFVEMVPYSGKLIGYLTSLSVEQKQRVVGMFSELPENLTRPGFYLEDMPENRIMYGQSSDEVPFWNQVIEKVQEFLDA